MAARDHACRRHPVVPSPHADLTSRLPCRAISQEHHRVGKLIYSLNVSLDGFAATTDGGLGWANVDEQVHTWFNDQTRAIEASLYGRRMWEVMAGYWPMAEDDPSASPVSREFSRIWKPMPKFVFSST